MRKLVIGMIVAWGGLVAAFGIAGCPAPGDEQSLKSLAGKGVGSESTVERVLAQLEKQEAYLKSGGIWLYTVKQDTGPSLPDSFNWDVFLRGVSEQEITSQFRDLNPSGVMETGRDGFIVAPGDGDAVALIAPWHVFTLRPDGGASHEWYLYQASLDGALLSVETINQDDAATPQPSVGGAVDFGNMLTPFAFGSGFGYSPAESRSMVSSLREWSLTLGGQTDNPILKANDWTNALPDEKITGGLEMISQADGRFLPVLQQFRAEEEAVASVSVIKWLPGEIIDRPEAMIPRLASRSLVWDDTGVDARDYTLAYALEAMQPYIVSGDKVFPGEAGINEKVRTSNLNTDDMTATNKSSITDLANTGVKDSSSISLADKTKGQKSVTILNMTFSPTHGVCRQSESWTDAGEAYSTPHWTPQYSNDITMTKGAYAGVSMMLHFPAGAHDTSIYSTSSTQGFAFEKRNLFSITLDPTPYSFGAGFMSSTIPTTVQNVDVNITWVITYYDSSNVKHTEYVDTSNRLHITLDTPNADCTSYRMEQVCGWAAGTSTSATAADAIGPTCVSLDYFGLKSIRASGINHITVWEVPVEHGDCISEAAFMQACLGLLGAANSTTLYLIQPCNANWSHLRSVYDNYTPEYIDVGGNTYPLGYIRLQSDEVSWSPNDYEGVLLANGMDGGATVSKYWMGGTGESRRKAVEVLHKVADPNTSISGHHQLYRYQNPSGVWHYLTAANQPTDNWAYHAHAPYPILSLFPEPTY